LADQKKKSGIVQPRNVFKKLGTLKLIHRLKWTWQLGNVALAMWILEKQT
jgi:hypothetical protein